MKAEDFKKALFVLPDSQVDVDHLARVQRALSYRFPCLEHTGLCVPDEHLFSTRLTLPDRTVQGFGETPFWEYPIAVLLLDQNQKSVGHERIDFNRCRVYEADRWAMLRFCRKELDKIEYPHVDTHAFNRIAAGLGNEVMTYFPYGYSSQYVGLGPLDPFGHRIKESLKSFVARPANHLLIAVFGGSAAWSTHTLYHEMFSQQLESKLNRECIKKGFPLKISVVNLAQPSGVTLNDIISYMLYCHEAAPDIVLLHCGANDLAFGQTSDRYLVSEHQIVYQFQLERWAEILEEKNQNPTDQTGWENLPIRTYPRQVIKAFITRANQFEQMVVKAGKHFILGLQPIIFSKKILSSDEEFWIDKTGQMFMGHILQNMPYLYDILTKESQKFTTRHFINLHNLFQEYEERKTLFCDAVHLNPDGDEIIATEYSNYCIKNILPQLVKNQ